MSDIPARPLLAFYGDHFTGSTDVMAALARAGVRTALSLEPPGPEALQVRFADLQAVGVVGTSRSMTPDQMETSLPPIFEASGRLGAGFVHYKTCSTFDFSPAVGSIGRAIDIGQRIFDPPISPLVVGAPNPQRYRVFGNLFATVGGETIHRGDTSGHAAHQLENDALEFLMPTAPGSPFCRVSSRRGSLDGLEIVLKGGQVGQMDFLGRTMRGTL